MRLSCAELGVEGSPLARRVFEVAVDSSPLVCMADPPVLLLLTGGSGSGKSTIRELLTRELPFVAIRNDRLRRACVERPTLSANEDGLFFASLDEAVLMFLSVGISVVWDARFPTRRLREEKRALVESKGFGFCCVFVETPRELRTSRRLCRKCKVRVGLQIDYYYDDVLRAMRAQNTTAYEDPRPDEDVIRFQNLEPPSVSRIAALVAEFKTIMAARGIRFVPSSRD